MTTFRSPALAITFALTLGAIGNAQALTIHHELSFDSNAAPLKTPAWSVTALLPQFDSALGILDSVKLTLYGHVEGSAKVESTNNGAREVTAILQSTLKLVNSSSGSTLVQTTPLVSNTFTASSYDGVSDFAGGSGRSFLNLANDASSSQLFTDVATLALFTGNGSVSTLLTAKGTSSYISSGNVDSQFRTKASGYASVTYAYHTISAVPEPTTWALMFAGLGVVGWLAKRRTA